MRKLFGLLGVVAALSCVWASGASAATEVGSKCQVSTAAGKLTLVPTEAQTGSVPPIAVPSAGVVTKWKMSVPGLPFTIPQTLKVLRPTGGANEFEIVAENTQNLDGGENSFEVTIPVQPGDRFGVYGGGEPLGTLACIGLPGSVSRGAKTPAFTGAKQTFDEEYKTVGVPILALVEPDADKDGFGDETQDKCPTSAIVQVACPALLLDGVSQPPGKKAVTILVATSIDVPITVSGTVKLPAPPKRAKSSAQAKLSAPAQSIPAGRIGSFKLKFPKALKSALASLPKKKSLTLKVTAQGANIAGVLSSDKLTVKLKGQG